MMLQLSGDDPEGKLIKYTFKGSVSYMQLHVQSVCRHPAAAVCFPRVRAARDAWLQSA